MPDEKPETIGEVHDRLPPEQWVSLPEYGVRVKRLGRPWRATTGGGDEPVQDRR
jgi:hypothetical protein